MVAYSKHFGSRNDPERTPQTEPIPGSSQVRNSEGGYSFAVDDWERVDRFLVLGSEGGSYYATEEKLTVENAQALVRTLAQDGEEVVRRIVTVSEAGRAPKNDPALFALAMAAGLGNAATKKAAFAALERVARIGTHLFTFLEDVQAFRGWGRGLRRAVAGWYNAKDVEALAYQLVKYQQRNGWSHRDALRLASPVPRTSDHGALYRWVVAKGNMAAREVRRQETKDSPPVIKSYPAIAQSALPPIIRSFEAVHGATSVEDVLREIENNRNLTWEMIPTEYLGQPKVWEALLPNLPMTALLRNLARMTANGLLAPMSQAVQLVSGRLRDNEAIKRARLHPISILGALLTYQKGHGVEGHKTWTPVTEVVDALDEAFYLSFDNVTPTGKRTMLSLDVSLSMTWNDIAKKPGLTPRIASAALALVNARVEKHCIITGFSERMVYMPISPRQRLDDVVRTIGKLPHGGTDCALPMVWALENNLKIDAFVVYTDNETKVGNIHPVQALREYRRKTGIPAKLIVVGMVANRFSIADPEDRGMLDVVGFDTATPELISDFITK